MNSNWLWSPFGHGNPPHAAHGSMPGAGAQAAAAPSTFHTAQPPVQQASLYPVPAGGISFAWRDHAARPSSNA
jgi:hypothetical protein